MQVTLSQTHKDLVTLSASRELTENELALLWRLELLGTLEDIDTSLSTIADAAQIKVT